MPGTKVAANGIPEELRRLLVFLGTLKSPILLANVHSQNSGGAPFTVFCEGCGFFGEKTRTLDHKSAAPMLNSSLKRGRYSLAGADRTPALLDQSHRRPGASGETSRCLAIISAVLLGAKGHSSEGKPLARHSDRSSRW